MKCCTKKCCSICGIVGGVILTLVAGLIYVITNPIIASELQVELIIDSPEALRYYDWACKFTIPGSNDCDVTYFAVPFYESYTMLNISNLEGVLNGEYPSLNEFGPYVYRDNITRFEIEFHEEGTYVSYREAHMYLFSTEKSCAGCQPTDRFTLINAGYLGAVDTAFTEEGLTLGMAGPAVDKIIRDIESTYIADKVAELGLEQVLADCTARAGETCVDAMDAAIVQWAYFKQRMPTSYGIYDEDVFTYYDGANALFPYPRTEMGSWAILNETSYLNALSLNSSKTLLYGEFGIVRNPLNLLEMVAHLNDTEYLEHHWNIVPLQATAFVNYFLHHGKTYLRDLVQGAINAGGGLFSTRSVHEWVFDYADPLLLLLQPDDPQTGIRTNDTSVARAAEYKGTTRIFTGANGNFERIADYVLWNSTDVVYYWPDPTMVDGNNQDGQFAVIPPDSLGRFPDILPDYKIWSPDHGRTVYLKDTGVKVRTVPGDIPVHRFALANETYNVSPYYEIAHEGFAYVGTFHMDPPFRHRLVFGAVTPLYMSQPRMWMCDAAYTAKVTYDKPANFDDCATIVDIEPLTGNVMGAKKQLQVNFYINSTSAYSRYDYKNIAGDIYFPQMYITQYADITEELAVDWNESLGVVMQIRDIVFIAGLVVGPVMIIAFGIMFAKAKKAASEYEAIN